MENLTLLKVVISTLNSVEVKGKDNLDKLLGSIRALETIVQAEEAAQKEEKVNEANTQEVDNG